MINEESDHRQLGIITRVRTYASVPVCFGCE